VLDYYDLKGTYHGSHYVIRDVRLDRDPDFNGYLQVATTGGQKVKGCYLTMIIRTTTGMQSGGAESF